MDPDANFAEQLHLAHQLLDRDDDEPLDDGDAERLAELVLSLDGWLRRGGFLPQAWKR